MSPFMFGKKGPLLHKIKLNETACKEDVSTGATLIHRF